LRHPIGVDARHKAGHDAGEVAASLIAATDFGSPDSPAPPPRAVAGSAGTRRPVVRRGAAPLRGPPAARTKDGRPGRRTSLAHAAAPFHSRDGGQASGSSGFLVDFVAVCHWERRRRSEGPASRSARLFRARKGATDVFRGPIFRGNKRRAIKTLTNWLKPEDESAATPAGAPFVTFMQHGFEKGDFRRISGNC